MSISQRDANHALVVACLAHALVIGAANMMAPALFTRWSTETGIDTNALATAWAWGQAPAFAGALLAAALRSSLPIAIVRTAIALTGLSAAARGLTSDSVAALTIANCVWGFCSGVVVTHLTAALLGQWRGPRQSLVQGIFFAAYGGGAVVGAASAPLLAALLGGAAPALIVVGVAGASLALFGPKFSPGLERPARAASDQVDRMRLLALAPVAGIFALYTAGYYAVSGLLPTTLVSWGWTESDAALAPALSTLGFMAGAVVVGSIWRSIAHARRPFAGGMIAAALLVVAIWRLGPGGDAMHPFIFAAAAACGFACGVLALAMGFADRLGVEARLTPVLTSAIVIGAANIGGFVGAGAATALSGFGAWVTPAVAATSFLLAGFAVFSINLESEFSHAGAPK